MSTESLQETNNKTLGTAAGTFPVITLPDGRKVPTGTVGALMVNVKAYDAADDTSRIELESAIRSAIPTLHKVGMFDLFAPEEWISNRSLGRSLVGRLAQDYIRYEAQVLIFNKPLASNYCTSSLTYSEQGAYRTVGAVIQGRESSFSHIAH